MRNWVLGCLFEVVVVGAIVVVVVVVLSWERIRQEVNLIENDNWILANNAEA